MSRTTAINKFCKRCIYDHKEEGTWRLQVENCKSGPDAKEPCALWPYRPVTSATIQIHRKDKITAGVTLDVDALIDGLEDEVEA